MIGGLVSRLGVLRFMLVATTVVLIAAAPFSGGGTQYSGLAMFPTLIAPALVPILFFVYPLDMTMNGVYMEGEPDRRARYRFIIRLDAAMMAVLALAWLPFFLDLLDV